VLAPSYQWRVAVTVGHDWTGAMTDIVLKDIDEFLLERIKRVADRRGWTMLHALRHLLEQGLYAVEGDGRLSFDNSEADVLQAAIAALEDVPDGVFSMIGQLPASGGR
jgi:hypothetical protein